MLPLSFGPGYLFAQRYKIERLLGAGGMGAVYEALHLQTARRRALKVMLPRAVGNDTLAERFAQEAQLGARIDSPFVVDVLDAGVDDATGLPYLVMELLRGENLGRRLQRGGRLPPEETVTYLHQAALALDRCHAADVVHRDVKPENLFLQERGDGQRQIKLLDLGVAKLLLPAETASTESVGTPAYMAPEQLVAGGRIGPATDIYALGMVAYATLVGRSYWDIEKRAANVFALADAIRGGARQAASQRARDAGVTLPPAFDAFFARVTHEAPKSRYPSAVSAVRALAEALGVQPLAAPEHPPSAAADVEAGASPVSAATLSAAGRSDAYGEVSVPTPRRGLARRPRLPWLAGGAVLLAIVAAGVLVPWSRGKAPAPAAAPPPAPAVASGAAPASVALPAAPAPVVTPPPAPREEKVGAAAAALPFPKADAPARRRLSGSARVARAKARAAAPEPTTDVGTSLYSRD